MTAFLNDHASDSHLLFEFKRKFLAQIQSLDLQPLDVAFASFIYRLESKNTIRDSEIDIKSIMSLLTGYLSKKLSNQDSCIALQQIPKQVLNSVGVNSHNSLYAALHESVLIKFVDSDDHFESSGNFPLVFENGNLYLQRYYHYELSLAHMIASRAAQVTQFDTELAARLFAQLFETNVTDQIDWQKVAVCIAASRQFSMITGGPGTGKTTTVAKLLCFLHGLHQTSSNFAGKLKIQLVAPTGKAAARMVDSLTNARAKLPEALQSALDVEAGTIHRLLGSQRHSVRFKHDSSNNLHIDVLIVDEASMVDLPLMCKLFEALPNYTRVILLGDPNQLASVEAGSVLSDICNAAISPEGMVQYDVDTQETLLQCTGQKITGEYFNPDATPIQNAMVKLLKSHRFDPNGGIGKLASAIVSGDANSTLAILNGSYADIDWQSIKAANNNEKNSREIRQQKLVMPRVAAAVDYFNAVQSGNIKLAFRLLQDQQILCSQRSGSWGVTAINLAVELELAKQGLIDLTHRDYLGRPIMLTQNDHSLGLYNGDIGIVMPDLNQSGLQKVWFNMPNGELQGFLINRLPIYETVYAMTVHKSQGSEFLHVYLCLSETISSDGSKGTSRELLYTGLTRAKDKFVLFADEQTVFQSVERNCARGSGLTQRLQLLT